MATLVTSAIRHNSSASNNMVLDSNGNVSVGTASPVGRLHVQRIDAGDALHLVGNSTFVGMANRTNFANSSAYSGVYYDARNENNVAVANMLCDIATDGSSAWSWSTQPAGTRTDRRVERMRIDASGRKTVPSQPGFYANGPAQNYVLGNQGNLNLSNAIYNIGSHYNTSTFRFTAPVAGRYLFTWSVFNNGAAGRCSLKLNGGAYADLNMDAGGGLSQSAILNLAANDFVTVGDWQNISGLNYWGSHSHFSGILLA